MFGSDPAEKKWLPNDGSHAALREGAPYGLIGTSSNYQRETVSRGKYPLTVQGGNKQRFDSSEIDAIRILSMEMPTYGRNSLKHTSAEEKTLLNFNEKLYILGEIPLRKFDENGEPIIDPDGNPDTSFLAKIRADEPFTFQLIDKKGKSLTTSMTWHHVRPGEVKTDCRGCHAHTGLGLPFELTEASNPGYDLADFTKTKPKRVEFFADVFPILREHRCVECHDGLRRAPKIDWKTGDSPETETWRVFKAYHSRSSPLIRRLETDDPAEKMPRAGDPLTEAEVRTIAEWIDTGAMRDPQRVKRDDTKPTLFVHSPRRDTSPLTRVVVSAADAELKKESLSVSLNGEPVNLTENDHIWSAEVPAVESGELVAEVRDAFGNVTRMKRTFGPGDEAR